jgi:predicted negative regulator of RcsB-dependent stress response
MAFDEYDDFEQEKLVKDWIKSNWLTIAVGIGLGLGGVIGINYWKSEQQQKRYEAAKQYSSFTEIMKLSQLDEAQTKLSEMKKELGENFYSYEGHLLLAKEFVNKKELDKAVDELKKVINSKPDKLLTELAKLRLARVYNAQAKHDEALAQVKSITISSFISIAKEIEGDSYFAKGDLEKAKSAFQDSIANGEGYSGKKNVEMKLENS